MIQIAISLCLTLLFDADGYSTSEALITENIVFFVLLVLDEVAGRGGEVTSLTHEFTFQNVS